MKVLILGAGQVGRTAAYHLAREPDNEVTMVDSNEAVLRELQSRLDVRTVAGNASYPAVLEAAGIADTDMLVALTSSEEVNMVACEIAHALFEPLGTVVSLPDEAHFCMHCGSATPPDSGVPPRTMPTGAVEVAKVRQRLGGRFRVERILGEGGMATVYLAEDLRHRRPDEHDIAPNRQ